MIKRILESLIKKKNPDFCFDANVSSRMIFSTFTDLTIEFIRGFILLIFHLKRPSLLFAGANVKMSQSQNIRLGKWVRLGTGVYLSGLGKGNLTIGNSSSIGSYSQVVISTSFNNIGEFIQIGNNVGIGQFSSLGGSGGVVIGNDTIIGQYFSCHPENHNYSDLNKKIRIQGTTRAQITIGQNCWIGAKVTILAGVNIGSNSIIAAGSVVTKSMPEFSIIGGVPAKIIKSRIV